MSDVQPINGGANPLGPTPVVRPVEGRGSAGGKNGAAAQGDRVEISELGQLLSTMEVDADIRIDKVMEIREAIANGTYETASKLEYTIDRLMEVLVAGE